MWFWADLIQAFIYFVYDKFRFYLKQCLYLFMVFESHISIMTHNLNIFHKLILSLT